MSPKKILEARIPLKQLAPAVILVVNSMIWFAITSTVLTNSVATAPSALRNIDTRRIVLRRNRFVSFHRSNVLSSSERKLSAVMDDVRSFDNGIGNRLSRAIKSALTALSLASTRDFNRNGSSFCFGIFRRHHTQWRTEAPTAV